MASAGLIAAISSIHANGWLGDGDKISTTRLLMQERFGIDLEANKNEFVFVVDAPNDALMSAYFPHSVGVANVKYSLDLLPAKPAYVTPSGYGNCFAELVDNLLAGK